MRSAVVDESASQFHSTKKTLITEHESPRTLPSSNGVTLLAKFDGEFAGRSNTYAGTGTIRYRW
jgi:hypothetical protein